MLARVFPRRTSATPDDPLAYFDHKTTGRTAEPQIMDFGKGITEVHISVAFTYDLPHAHQLAEAWSAVAPVQIGGPATGQRGEEFTPGLYLKPGYVITSRGCPNRCGFCNVWRRDGDVRELPITEGWNVLDDNLLACSEGHINSVFRMLAIQKESGHRIQFTGGLEAAKLEDWHVDALSLLRPKQMFFAYDDPFDYRPLVNAAGMLTDAGFTRNHLRCYVLIGYGNDTIEKAEKRLTDVLKLGMFPMAMLWRGEDGKRDPVWARFQKGWARPALIARK